MIRKHIVLGFDNEGKKKIISSYLEKNIKTNNDGVDIYVKNSNEYTNYIYNVNSNIDINILKDLIIDSYNIIIIFKNINNIDLILNPLKNHIEDYKLIYSGQKKLSNHKYNYNSQSINNININNLFN